MDFATLNRDDIALWLYGSRARGDADLYSDFDVLAISDTSVDEDEVAHLFGSNVSSIAISRYNWMELEGMAKYGSLFLHHIRLEGKRVFEAPHVSEKLGKILATLGPYKRVWQDLSAFRAGLCDVRQSLGEGGSVVFELSVLATIMRHAAILGCYIAGYPAFGRLSPVERLADLQLLEKSVACRFNELYACRLRAVRGAKMLGEASSEDVQWWLGQIDGLLTVLEGRARGFERDVS